EQMVWYDQKRQLRTSYYNKDFHRGSTCCILHDVPVRYANGRLFFEIELEQNQRWHTCAELILEHGQHIEQPKPGACSQDKQGTASTGATPATGQEPRSNFDERQARWQARCTNITTSNNDLDRMYRQAIEDMGGLR